MFRGVWTGGEGTKNGDRLLSTTIDGMHASGSDYHNKKKMSSKYP